eukprot:9656686-Lingulodinium_polyedra.AAC.1
MAASPCCRQGGGVAAGLLAAMRYTRHKVARASRAAIWSDGRARVKIQGSAWGVRSAMNQWTPCLVVGAPVGHHQPPRVA